MLLGNLSSVVSRVTIKRHGRSQSHRVRILGCISETPKATRKTEGLTRPAIACQEACKDGIRLRFGRLNVFLTIL